MKEAILLYADHDALQRKIVRFVLEDAGFTVVTAKSNREALRLANDTMPALIILGLEPVEPTGLAALRRLKADGRLNTIPILLMSTCAANHPAVQTAFDAGAAGYILKPNLNLRRLPAIIRDYLPLPDLST